MTIRTISAIATLAMLASSPALAAQADETTPLVRHQIVHTANLDLSTPAGVAALHRRLAKAESLACRPYPAWDLDEMIENGKESARCRTEARLQANQRVAALMSNSVQLSSR